MQAAMETLYFKEAPGAKFVSTIHKITNPGYKRFIRIPTPLIFHNFSVSRMSAFFYWGGFPETLCVSDPANSRYTFQGPAPLLGEGAGNRDYRRPLRLALEGSIEMCNQHAQTTRMAFYRGGFHESIFVHGPADGFEPNLNPGAARDSGIRMKIFDKSHFF
jgi:hypothetical protein